MKRLCTEIFWQTNDEYLSFLYLQYLMNETCASIVKEYCVLDFLNFLKVSLKEKSKGRTGEERMKNIITFPVTSNIFTERSQQVLLTAPHVLKLFEFC